MENKLYSHFGWMKKFSWDHPPQCPCQRIRELHPDLTTTSIAGVDHNSSEARLLNVSRRLKFWLSCSAQTQVYPDFEEYCRISWHAVDQWLKHYKIGGIQYGVIQYSSWREFINKQWIIHRRSAFVLVSMADIRFLRALVADLVVQGRDHAAAHIHIYCPFLYHHVLKSTFGDPKVYTRRNMTPTAAQKHVTQIAASAWLRKYRWGIREHTDVPTSYSLLKAKKKFLGARPIINYQSFPFGRLFRCTAFVLMAMMKDVFPHSFGNATLPQMFSSLHSTPSEHHLLQSNQDLVGFFTSIPADRIHNAVNWMLQRYKELHQDTDNMIFTVFPKEKDVQLRIFRCTKRALQGRAFYIRLGDILPLCMLSLQTSLFTQMQQVFQQVRGSAIGNQISPVLADIAVSYVEQQWWIQNEHLIRPFRDHFFICRYVDNRLVVFSEAIAHCSWMKELCQLEFYQHPVELEEVESGEFLGTVLHPAERRLAFIIPNKQFQFKPSNSAGSDSHKMAAVNSRICLASRCSFPQSQRDQDVHEIGRQYINRDYPAHKIARIQRKFLRQ